MNNPKLSYWFHTLGRYWAVILIGGFITWSIFSDSITGTSSPLPAPVAQVSGSDANQIAREALNQASQSNFQVDTVPISLTTGTILKKRSAYLQGYGELQIKNGTSEDAVAKLIRDGTSILTVYIKANSTYTMKDISDGTYWLAFTQGLDWDAEAKTFRRGVGYSAFEETFDFETTDTQYSIYEVTLNPVVGGTAKTSDVNEAQFSAY